MIFDQPFLTGEANMSHTIANLEAHHFKYPWFRRPGDVHVHSFGTATLSFAAGIRTKAGDVFEIEAEPIRPAADESAADRQEGEDRRSRRSDASAANDMRHVRK